MDTQFFDPLDRLEEIAERAEKILASYGKHDNMTLLQKIVYITDLQQGVPGYSDSDLLDLVDDLGLTEAIKCMENHVLSNQF